MVAVTQHSFAAGELSPGFWGRTDHPRYRYGVRKAENCIVSAHGSLRKRPGMEHVRDLGADARLFCIGTKDGPVLAALFINKILIYDGTTPTTLNFPTGDSYSNSELNRVQICQLGDTVTLILAGHRPLELLNNNGVFSIRERPAVFRDAFTAALRFSGTLRNGLLGWYEFNNTYKSSTSDVEPTFLQEGSATIETGGRPTTGKCLTFSGGQNSNAVIYSEASSPDLSDLNNFTVSFWVNINSTNSTYPTPVSIGPDFVVYVSKSNQRLYVYYGGSAYQSYVPVAFNEWIHIVVQGAKNGQNVTLNLFVNGERAWQTIVSAPSAQAHSCLTFGTRNGSTAGSYYTTATSYTFKGSISAVGIWKRKLNSVEVSALYGNGNGIFYSLDGAEGHNPVFILEKLREDVLVVSGSTGGENSAPIEGGTQSNTWLANNFFDIRLTHLPEDPDHTKQPWTWRFGFVYETPERGEFEAVSDRYTFKVDAACYTDWNPHYVYVNVPEPPTGMTLKALKVYRGQHGIFGLVKRSELSDTSEPFQYYTAVNFDSINPALMQAPGNSYFCAIDDGSTPDLSQQPPVPLEDDPDIFCTENSYPNSIGWFEQRTVFGGHTKKPRTLFLSKSGQRYEFTKNGEYAPLDSDAMALDLATTEHERITAVTALNGRLIVLTDKNLWACGSTGQAMTPSDASAVCYNGVGCSGLKPLALRNSLLFVSQNGNEIFEIRADQQGTQWATRELGTFARHLLDGHKIVSWDFQSTPDPVVWLVREDGVLLSLSYNAETELCAWTRHKTDAAVKSVCVIGTDVYLSVVRNNHWQAERMPMQGKTHFLDGERKITPSTALTPSFGLQLWNVFSEASSLPLEGAEVISTLPVHSTATVTHLVGNPVECTVELLDAVSFEDVGLRPKTLKKISVDFISNSTLSLSEDMKGRSTPERLNGTSERRIAFAHVIHGYGAEATGAIRSSQPCPMTLLGVAREVDFGDSSMQGAGGAQGGR